MSSTFQDYAEGSSGPPRKIRQVLGFLLTFTLAFGGLHYLVYLTAARSLEAHSFGDRFLFWLFTFGLFSLPIGILMTERKAFIWRVLTWFTYTWLGFFNFLFFLSLIEILILAFFFHTYSYWIFYAAILITFWSLYRGLSFPQTITHRIKNEKLRGFSMVQISDLHIGMLHLRKKWVQRVVQTVLELKPNAIAVTGDLIESRYRFVMEEISELGRLNSISEKFYITGNHEYMHGGPFWEAKLQQLGFTILHNTHKIIDHGSAKIMVAGVPDRMIKRFTRKTEKSNPDKALKSDQVVDYKILLAHQPASVKDLKEETCDLILSGHTHGGQIFPFHFLVRLAQPVVSGFKTIKNILVFAHQGTGLWGPPMRWFSRSEIVVFIWE